jgi:hypothetical protein
MMEVVRQFRRLAAAMELLFAPFSGVPSGGLLWPYRADVIDKLPGPDRRGGAA